MIKVKIFKNKAGSIFAFEIIDHGKDIVCSAVTALSFNAVNSIELFTDAKFKCDLEEDGGYYFSNWKNLRISPTIQSFF